MHQHPRIAAVALAIMLPLLAAASETIDGDVDQKGLRFTKASVAIPVGASTHFRNSDDVIHNIMTIDENDEPEDRGLQKPGETITAKFEKAGIYQVRCAIHPKMKMIVKVDK